MIKIKIIELKPRPTKPCMGCGRPCVTLYCDLCAPPDPAFLHGRRRATYAAVAQEDGRQHRVSFHYRRGEIPKD